MYFASMSLGPGPVQLSVNDPYPGRLIKRLESKLRAYLRDQPQNTLMDDTVNVFFGCLFCVTEEGVLGISHAEGVMEYALRVTPDKDVRLVLLTKEIRARDVTHVASAMTAEGGQVLAWGRYDREALEGMLAILRETKAVHKDGEITVRVSALQNPALHWGPQEFSGDSCLWYVSCVDDVLVATRCALDRWGDPVQLWDDPERPCSIVPPESDIDEET